MTTLVIFIQASPIRLRIFPAAFVTLFFFALEVTPIWFFLRPHPFVSVQVEYLVLFPLYLFALFFLSVRTMKFVFDHIVPELPGVVMDILSQATETVARKSYHQYAELSEEARQPVYYGRVVREQAWTVLQYHFFYAFNDWRLGANGINHHEGDWEMLAVYLKDDEPYAVLLSQHGAGAMEMWQNVRRVKDASGHATTHPLIYTALGSHANYSKPEVIACISWSTADLSNASSTGPMACFIFCSCSLTRASANGRSPYASWHRTIPSASARWLPV